MLYDLYQARGRLEMSKLSESWCYSKQTISSALKTLEQRELVETCYVEGSKKNKLVALTPKGTAFVFEHIRPAAETEWRAFTTLAPEERQTMVNLLKKYVAALDAEMGVLFKSTEERGEK